MKTANAIGLVLKNGSIVVDMCSRIGLCKKFEEDGFCRILSSSGIYNFNHYNETSCFTYDIYYYFIIKTNR